MNKRARIGNDSAMKGSAMRTRMIGTALCLTLSGAMLTACMRDPGMGEAPATPQSLNNVDPGKANYRPDLVLPKISTIEAPDSPHPKDPGARPGPAVPLAKTSDITTRYVGIIPADAAGWTACPTGDQVTFYMDDEDAGQNERNNSQVVTFLDYNRDGNYGYVPWGLQDGLSLDGKNNTTVRLCRVPGATLKPLQGAGRADFAVLRLDSECPDGAYKFAYYMDNEDGDNHNHTVGNIWPSSQGGPNTMGWTRLEMCYFPGNASGATTLPTLPTVGNNYAFFAQPGFSYGSFNGELVFDEEDNANNSYFDFYGLAGNPNAADYQNRIKQIIVWQSGGTATSWRFARRTLP